MRLAVLWASLIATCARSPLSDQAEAARRHAVVVPVVGGAGGEASAAREGEEPIDPASLHPLLMLDAPWGAAPTALIIDLLHPVVSSERTRTPPTETVLTFSPPLPGKLSWESPSRLRFEPATALPPSASFTATLSRVDGRDGPIDLLRPSTLTWTTPALALHHVSLVKANPGSAEQLLEAAFTGAVDPASVALSATAGRSAATLGPITAGASPHLVRFTARSPALSGASSVEVRLQAGARSAASPTSAPAPAGQATVGLPAPGKGVAKILHVRAQEGSSGFAIEVVCDDASVTDRQWQWDEVLQDSYEISRRCELDAASLGLVHLEPARALRVTPTGTGFRLLGDISRGAWSLRVDAGARTVDGGVLAEPWEGTLIIPGRSPLVDLVATGRYLPRDAWTQLPLRHRNTGSVAVTLRHVGRPNLPFWLSGDGGAIDERTSEVVARTRVALGGAVDTTETAWLDLAGLVPRPSPGVYQIETRFGDATDQARLLVTDLQLVAKAGSTADKTWDVWAVDVHTLKPLPQTAIELIRPSGQRVATCNTAGDGHCRLGPVIDPLDETAPLGLFASRGDDFTYLRFDDVLVPQASGDTTGEPFTSAIPWRASLHTERGVYRPGETAHLVAILRDGAQKAPPVDMPLRLDIQDSRGRVLRQFPGHANAAGLFTADLPLSDDAATGSWEARLVVGADVIRRHRFSVEDFVPERMEVMVKPLAADLLYGEAARFGVDARYLFGGSAEGSRVELRCHIEPTRFAPPRLAEWSFDHEFTDDLRLSRIDLGSVEGTLDATGHADLTCPPTTTEGLTTGTLVGQVAVFEAGSGRSTDKSATATVHPARHHLGLKTAVTRVEVGQPVSVDGIVADWQGNIIDTVTEIQVDTWHLEGEWDWGWDADRGYETWRHWRRPVADGSQKVQVSGGRFRFTFQPAERGAGYLVRVRGAGAVSDLVLDMDAWGWDEWGNRTDGTPGPSAPGTVLLTTPDLIEVGDEVEVSFDAPYAGRALITVETDHVLASEWLDVKPGPVAWGFELDGFAPNVYVGVLVLKDPHAESREAFLPDRAWGTRAIRVTPSAWKLPVTLSASATMRSAQTLDVQVTVGGDEPTWVTVAAVDEGILQLTRFVTPDPLADLFPRRALGVSTWETLGWSVSRAARSSAVGGDAAGAPRRPSPVKPVALWSGLVQVHNGKATVKLEVPAWDGRLRVFAIAATPTRTGSAETSVTVADPLVVEATVPRYLLSGDRAEIPVFVTNTTAVAEDVAISMTVEPLPLGGFTADTIPVDVIGASGKTVRLSPGASTTAVFQLSAHPGAGAARLTFKAKGSTFTSTREHELGIQPSTPSVRRIQQVALKPGETPLAPLLTGWTPGTERTSAWVTTSPYAQAFAHLDDLVSYPHGCVEQTSSGLRPLLYATHLIPGAVARLGGREEIDHVIRDGIDRILSMQTGSGGFGYWPGSDDPSLWGTIQATHLLIDAAALGHHVPPEATAAAIAWISRQVDEVAAGRRSLDAGSEAYAHWVLARADQPRRGRAGLLLQALQGNLTGISADQAAEATYLTKAALFRAGDRRHEAALRALDTSSVRPQRVNGYTFFSDLRRRGLALTVHEDLFGTNDASGQAAAEALARLVGAARPHSLTTQELGWVLTALGKRVSGQPADIRSLRLHDGPTDIEGLTVAKDLSDLRYTVWRASERPALGLTVDATAGNLYLILQSEGVRPDEPWRMGGSGLELHRAFFDSAGQPTDPSSLELGDLLYAVITLRATATPVANVALVDRLPAGWEVENPRTTDHEGMGFADDFEDWYPEWLDVRDDHLSFYGTVRTGDPKKVVYALRATSAGSYIIPPIQADAMYDPAVWARAAGGITLIDGHWQASFL